MAVAAIKAVAAILDSVKTLYLTNLTENVISDAFLDKYVTDATFPSNMMIIG